MNLGNESILKANIFNSFEKSNVKAHTRKTKSGKITQVRQYQDSKTKKIKLLDDKKYHLTGTEKKNIKYMIDKNILSGRIGSKNYFIKKKNNFYEVKIESKTRGLIPVEGSKLRTTEETINFYYK